jgi:hypothetical protein
MIIIGSTAMNYWYPDHQCNDVDVFVDEDEEHTHPSWDVLKIPANIMKFLEGYSENGYLIPDALFSLKLSHMQRDHKWEKFKNQILDMKYRYDLDVIPEVYDTMLEFWEGLYGGKDFLNLNQDKSEFFRDNVTYIIDHDRLHEIVARPDRPVYELVLKDGHDVLTDVDKFNRLPHHFIEYCEELYETCRKKDKYFDMDDIFHFSMGDLKVLAVGSEGIGEACYSVLELKGNAFKVQFSYHSQFGYNTDGWYNTVKLVVPKQKTVTVYEEKEL